MRNAVIGLGRGPLSSSQRPAHERDGDWEIRFRRETTMATLRIPRRWALVVALMPGLILAAPLLAQEEIQIGLPVPNYGPYVPLFAAQDLGIYKKDGVAVEFTTYRGGQ